jgi:two-component system chemotaxis sensor kinase CheA
MDEVVKEFLIESHENLNQLDHDLVELEKDPHAKALLDSVFRTIHSIKGVSGFLDFPRLEAVTHAAENLLSRLRDGELILNQAVTSALLATVDSVREMLARIEADGNDGERDYPDLVVSLTALCSLPPLSTIPAAVEYTASTSKTSTSEGEVAAPAAPADLPCPAAELPAHDEHLEVAMSAAADSSIRVNVNLLDRVMNLVGELVLVRNQILQFSTRYQESGFLSTSQRLNLITSELQEGIMKTRMQPIGNIWNKFPRVARDLAIACSKQVRIEMEGEDTELDKTLIEAIRDPLTHIVRNSIDHGIELPHERLASGKAAEGRLSLRALHESGQVIIEVADDGAGINLERVRAKARERGLITAVQAAQMSQGEVLRLLFLPGFSTAKEITNLSGRGVGMDVVKTNIEKIGGSVEIQSVSGQGTRLRIKIPLTLAIIPALIVTCAGDRYAIPQVSLIELVRIAASEQGRKIELIHGAPVYRLRGRLLPLVYLQEVLKVTTTTSGGETAAPGTAHIVVLQVADQQFGLVVDQVCDTEEIVVKPLGRHLIGLSAFAGATIMGDGRVALIVDVPGVAQLSGVLSVHDGMHADGQDAAPGPHPTRQRLLLCRAGSSERVAVPLALVSRLEQFSRAQIERAAGCEVVRYRGRILPLIDLAALLGSGVCGRERDPVAVVVVDDGNHHRVGMVVDQIIDVVESEISAIQLSSYAGLLGTAVVGDLATDFLDLHAVLTAARQTWYHAEPTTVANSAILLIDQSAFSRGLVRGYLEMAGHHVLEATGATDAMEKLEGNHVDLAIVSANLPSNGAGLAQLRAKTSQIHIPVMGLDDDREATSNHDETSVDAGRKYDSYHLKSERQAILAAVARLTDGAPLASQPAPEATPDAQPLH